MRIRLATQSYRSDSLPVSAQRCVNMYAERQPPDAKTDVAVFGCPGIPTFTTCGAGPVRGGHVMGGLAYVVSGAFLYSYTDEGVATQLGGQISGSSVVSMDDNGDELVITNGSNGYVYSTDAGFRLISDADFNAANTVSYIDGFFAFDSAGTNEWQISDSLSGTSFSDLFASAETKSDNVLAVLNHLQLLHVFGERTIELFQNVGAANFPFQRVPAGLVTRGIVSPHAKAVEDSAVFALADDKIAYRLAGATPQKVSTYAIDKAWEGYRILSDCFGLGHTFGGHKFITFTMPAANATWVFDISSGLWHERTSHDMNGNALGRWCGNCIFPAYGKTFVGDAFSGKVGYIDAGTYTEFGNDIRAEVISPPVHGDGKRVFVPYFELDVEPGVGLESGQGSNPQYMLDISNDDGKTFDLPQVWASAGKTGDNKVRLVWDRLGSAESFVFRVTCSDPVKRVIYAARCPELRIGL